MIGPIPKINEWFSIHTREWERRGHPRLDQVHGCYILSVVLAKEQGNTNLFPFAEKVIRIKTASCT